MEQEVQVPVSGERVRAALADPARVARAVPGLHQEAGAEPVAGRLKVRIGGTTITYRGTATLTARPDGTYAVECEAVESRGTGSVTFTLVVAVRDGGEDGGEDGATVVFSGTGAVDGRAADLPDDAVATAVARLLKRFAGHLGAAEADTATPSPDAAAPATPAPATPAPATPAPATPAPDAAAPGAGAGDSAAEEASAEPAGGESPGREAEGGDSGGGDSGGEESGGAGSGGAGSGGADSGRAESGDGEAAAGKPAGDEPAAGRSAASLHDAEAPPLAPEPLPDDLGAPAQPPAEAAHARRTMIGRSAEEVDHAPPRGRYAPVPAPQSAGTATTLRWAAPAAALVVASVIVAGRVLRRRRL